MIRSAPLAQPAPLLQCSDRKLRCFAVSLEAGQLDRLWGTLPRVAQEALGIPRMALRLPLQHATLVIRRQCKSILVPHMLALLALGAVGKHGGGISMNIDWDSLGLTKPGPPDVLDVLRSAPGLEPAMCLQIADRLRQFTPCLDTITESGEDDYHNLQCFVHVFQTVHDQMQAVFLTKMVNNLRSRVALSSMSMTACRKLKYNVTWMLHVLMCDCLRSSATLAQAVGHSLHLVVPPVLLPMFQRILDDPSALQPDAGTVSRWRLLLDGALMQWHRSKAVAGQAVRSVMSDSSSQRGRSFQLTAIQTISLDALARCFRGVLDLINMWHGL